MTNAMQKQKAAGVNAFDNIFNNTLRRFFDGNLWDVDGTSNLGQVPVNVRETDHQYELDVIAPGCRKEDFNIHIQNNELQVSMMQQEDKTQKDENAGWVRNEYLQRSFSRRFSLDETVNVESITASYTDGILRIVLPKSEKAKPRKLSIDVK